MRILFLLFLPCVVLCEERTWFHFVFDLKCPLNIPNFKYQIDFYEWETFTYNDHLGKVSGSGAGNQRIKGALEGMATGDEWFSSGYQIVYNVTHNCTPEGKDTCELWEVGGCEIGRHFCYFDLTWDLIAKEKVSGSAGPQCHMRKKK